ncbi:hypothetical protein HK102_007235, partial [Quaeritorhiza haematococci]
TTLTVKSQNALTQTAIFNRKTDNFTNINAHYAVLSLKGEVTNARGLRTKVPIVGMPLEIVPAERDQVLYAVDVKSGEVVEKKIRAYARHRLYSNAEGRVSFWFPVKKDSDVLLPRRHLRHRKIANISVNALKTAKPDMSQNSAPRVFAT